MSIADIRQCLPNVIHQGNENSVLKSTVYNITWAKINTNYYAWAGTLCEVQLHKVNNTFWKVEERELAIFKNLLYGLCLAFIKSN